MDDDLCQLDPHANTPTGPVEVPGIYLIFMFYFELYHTLSFSPFKCDAHIIMMN